MKTHAMVALIQRLENFNRFDKSVKNYSRLKSVTPGLLGLLAGLAAGWYFEHWIILAISALVVLLTLKNIVARLWSPTVLTNYSIANRNPEQSLV